MGICSERKILNHEGQGSRSGQYFHPSHTNTLMGQETDFSMPGNRCNFSTVLGDGAPERFKWCIKSLEAYSKKGYRIDSSDK